MMACRTVVEVVLDDQAMEARARRALGIAMGVGVDWRDAARIREEARMLLVEDQVYALDAGARVERRGRARMRVTMRAR